MHTRDQILRFARLFVVLCLVAAGWSAPRPVQAATITVTTTAEAPGSSGDCTLGEAIQAAQTNAAVDACPAGAADDVIVLQAGATYSLTTGTLAAFAPTAFIITGTLTLDGHGAALARGGPPDLSLRFFYVDEAGALTLNSLTLRGGRLRGGDGSDGVFDGEQGSVGDSVEGGAVYNEGVLVLDGVRFEANRVQGGDGGDAMGEAFAGDGGHGTGGALYNRGSVSIVGAGAVFTGNQAAGGVGGMGQPGGKGGQADGGALASYASLEATAPVVFEHNQSLGGLGGGGTEPGLGGGAHGAALTNVEQASLTGAVFFNNAALAGEGGAGPSEQANGGFVAGGVVQNLGDLALTHGLIYSNTAHAALGNTGGSVVGGILLHGTGSLRLTSVRVLSNTTTGGDAAPKGDGVGGDVAGTFSLQSGAVHIEQSAFIGNQLLPGDSQFGPALAYGAGLHVLNASARLTNTTFAGNTAAEGSALYTQAPVTLTHVTVAHNTGGPALRALGPYLWLYNSLVAHNATANCDSANQAAGTANLQYPGATCGAGVTVGDPLLGDLTEQDGMPYLPLLSGSPARDAATGYCPAVDQRGVARPLGAECDLGAVEAGGYLFLPFIMR